VTGLQSEGIGTTAATTESQDRRLALTRRSPGTTMGTTTAKTSAIPWLVVGSGMLQMPQEGAHCSKLLECHVPST
jgi:hypothetical protein